MLLLPSLLLAIAGAAPAAAARVVRRFIRTLSAGDTGCASRIKEVSTVDSFPRSAAAAGLARSRSGDASRPRARRAAAVAAATVADAIQRWANNFSGVGRGLRGGRWSYSGDDTVSFRLRRVRFADDVAVSGTATWTISSGAVRADLRVAGASSGRLTARWNLHRRLARARLAGKLDGRVLRAVMLAP
jgi:hypothetical protein